MVLVNLVSVNFITGNWITSKLLPKKVNLTPPLKELFTAGKRCNHKVHGKEWPFTYEGIVDCGLSLLNTGSFRYWYVTPFPMITALSIIIFTVALIWSIISSSRASVRQIISMEARVLQDQTLHIHRICSCS